MITPIRRLLHAYEDPTTKVTSDLLEKVLPELLEAAHVPPALRLSLWNQHDGTPLHYEIHVHEEHLKVTFGQRRIGRGGPVHYPARSPNLSCLDFWGQMKCLMYEMQFPSVEDLISRISV
ncbi:uncharacterized protein TNCV_1674321 [Trichonephila clavipes]|nr:uncharacterized protein TNCV_1674321 [Trichonephila clavipes]